MIYIIFDLEWNMASGHYEEVGKPRIAKNCSAASKKRIPCFEIFQIGAVSMTGDWQIKEHYSALIKPQIYPQINKYVQRLTKVKHEDLKVSPPFNTVIYDFYAWIWQQFSIEEQEKACLACNLNLQENAEQFYSFSELQSLLQHLPLIFGTWSTSDAKPLRENLNYYALPNNLPAPFIDIQRLYELFSGDAAGAHSVKRAVDYLQIDPEEAYHDALNDALYTALILQKLEDSFRWAAWDYLGFPLPEKFSLRDVSHETYLETDDNSKNNTRGNEQTICSIHWPVINIEHPLSKRTSTNLFISLGADLANKNYLNKLKQQKHKLVNQDCRERKYSLQKLDERLARRLHLISQTQLENFMLTFTYDPNQKILSDDEVES